MKICSKCKLAKSIEEFGKRKNKYMGVCKQCTNARLRSWRERNPEKSKQYTKNWEKRHPNWRSKYEKGRRQEPERKAYLKKYGREWIRKKKKKFLLGKSCERCNRAYHVGLFSQRDGKKIHQLRPWYGKANRDDYLILCRLCWEAESSDRISWHWEKGTYDYIPALLHEYATAMDVMAETDGQEGHSLLYLTYQLTKVFPDIIRDDMCQEMVFDVLSKQVEIEDLPQLLSKYRTRAYQKFMPKYGELSLDHPINRDSDTPLGSLLSIENIRDDRTN